jgi:cyclophilin family peptidyl-prolyl cis-trans isomerase
VLAQLEKDFPNDLRVVFRHFPLIGTPEQPFHDKAAISAQAAEAAGLQGKFWEMYELLMENQGEWAGMTIDQFKTWVVEKAAGLGLDVDRFEKDLTSDAMVQKIQAAWEHGQEIGLPGTPFILLNGAQYSSGLDQSTLSAVIKLTLLQKRQYNDCPPMVIDPAKKYLATLRTGKGDIVIELFADKAPLAVNNFVFLSRNGWYDNVAFHRVLPGFVAQAGDPTGTGYGGPGYAFTNEISPDLNFDSAGLVAMANAGADSNGSQFFITFAPATQLNGDYTIFGRVISGMDVAESLTPRDPSQTGNLPEGDKIISVTIEEK